MGCEFGIYTARLDVDLSSNPFEESDPPEVSLVNKILLSASTKNVAVIMIYALENLTSIRSTSLIPLSAKKNS